MGNNIRHFRELDVYHLAMEAVMMSHPEKWTIRSVREGEADYA